MLGMLGFREAEAKAETKAKADSKTKRAPTKTKTKKIAVPVRRGGRRGLIQSRRGVLSPPWKKY